MYTCQCVVGCFHADIDATYLQGRVNKAAAAVKAMHELKARLGADVRNERAKMHAAMAEVAAQRNRMVAAAHAAAKQHESERAQAMERCAAGAAQLTATDVATLGSQLAKVDAAIIAELGDAALAGLGAGQVRSRPPNHVVLT